jgi:uncharacterized membrane protein YedE/YeeE
MNMAYLFTAFGVGLVFGIGLIVADMSNPARILAFLDLGGQWDPSLALVMVAAVVIGIIAFAWAQGRTRSLLGAPMRLPSARQIDSRLVIGGLTFGVGWGLSGFCPGPALVATAAGQGKALVFVLAMLAGMLAFEFIERARTRRHPAAAGA